MTRGALASRVALAVALVSSVSAAQADGDRVRACMSPGQSREILIQQKFIAPFRALAEVQRTEQGEVVGLQLCRLGEAFVYDVTLLMRDGRVSHSLVNARTGAVVAPARSAK